MHGVSTIVFKSDPGALDVRAPRLRLLLAIVIFLVACRAHGQSTVGTGSTVVFPITAQTASYASEVTLYNPNESTVSLSIAFYEAINSSSPGAKPCASANIAAQRSLQFSVGVQCRLPAGSHFGVLVVTDASPGHDNAFYGYTRVQNPQGIGFSIEGFPARTFTNEVSQVVGLKKQAAFPTYQTNCFVGALDQPVSYRLRLFKDTTGARIGNTLVGSLDAFQQFRYLDVFGPNGVNAPDGDQFNVRAEFTQTSGGSAKLVGFCTVQDNTSFAASSELPRVTGSSRL